MLNRPRLSSHTAYEVEAYEALRCANSLGARQLQFELRICYLVLFLPVPECVDAGYLITREGSWLVRLCMEYYCTEYLECTATTGHMQVVLSRI